MPALSHKHTNKPYTHKQILLFLLFRKKISWWRHQMETFSALLAFRPGNSPVTGELPARRPLTRSFYVFFVLRLNKQWSKQSWGQWLGTLSRSLWRQCNVGRRRLPWHLQCSISGYNFHLTYRGLENAAILHDNCSILINISLKIVSNHPSIKKSTLV